MLKMAVSMTGNIKYNPSLNRSHTCLLIIVAICICMFFASSCIFSYKEPVKKPEITFVSISDGEIITTRDVTIFWEGNTDAAYYQYIIDTVESDIISDNSVTLTDLDEKDHLFILKAFDDSLEVKSTPLLIYFTIDALQGPGILLSPRRISESSVINISLVEINHIMAAHIEFVCENRCVAFEEFTPNMSLVNNGEMITLIDSTSPDRFIIDIAFAGRTEGLSGSSLNIGTLTVNPQRIGNIIVDSSGTVFRNTVNETITINELDFVSVIK